MEASMKRGIRRAALLAVAVMLSSEMAFAQTKPECDKTKTPQTLEGHVVAIDLNQSKVTMRGSDGVTHEFQASKETLQGYKVGDRIEAKLRSTPDCK
jgi:ribosomal protein S1